MNTSNKYLKDEHGDMWPYSDDVVVYEAEKGSNGRYTYTKTNNISQIRADSEVWMYSTDDEDEETAYVIIWERP